MLGGALWLSGGAVHAAERLFAPGQEALLAELVGRGVDLPGGCRFVGGGIDGTTAHAEYACGTAETVVLELRAGDAAPAMVLSVRRGAPPPALLATLRERVRRREAQVVWRSLDTASGDAAPLRLAAVGGLVIALGLVGQVLLCRRLVARQGHTARGGAPRAATAGGRAAVAGLVVLYLCTRLPCLTRLPVYIDEALHIDWARAGFGSNLLAQVSVGKWLPVQVMTVMLSALPIAPLPAARLGSVAMGLASLLACIGANRRLFAVREGLLAGAIYTLLPFALLYDRLALADVYVSAATAWVLYGAVAMVAQRGAAWPLVMSGASYAAMLSKPSGALCLAVPPLAALLLVPRGARVAYALRALPTLVGGVTLLGVLVVGGYGSASLFDQSAFAAERMAANLATASDWLGALLTPSVAWAGLAALLWAAVGLAWGRRAEAFLAAVCLLMVAPYVIAARVWYPQYLLSATVPLAMLLGRASAAAARAAQRMWHRGRPARTAFTDGLAFALLALLAMATAPLQVALVRRPDAAALPAIERARYVTGSLAGYGLPELADFLRQESRAQPITVVRCSISGPLHQGLDVYLAPSATLRWEALDPTAPDARAALTAWASRQRTLVVLDPAVEATRVVMPALADARRVWLYTRPDAQSTLEVWELPTAPRPE